MVSRAGLEPATSGFGFVSVSRLPRLYLHHVRCRTKVAAVQSLHLPASAGLARDCPRLDVRVSPTLTAFTRQVSLPVPNYLGIQRSVQLSYRDTMKKNRRTSILLRLDSQASKAPLPRGCHERKSNFCYFLLRSQLCKRGDGLGIQRSVQLSYRDTGYSGAESTTSPAPTQRFVGAVRRPN